MDISERQQRILDILRDEERVEVEDLARRFSVTAQTVRADLRDLADRGLVRRTHGGARRMEAVVHRDYAERRAHMAREKAAIGALAAGLIPDDCSVALNIGTTTEMVARALAGRKGLMVLSNNINIVTMLMGAGVRELILAGGTVRQSDGAIVGEEAVEFFARFKVDYAIIGASALDADGAVLDFDSREVAVARAILRNARTRILVCDSSKFDRTAPVRICDVSQLDYLVTDRPPPPSFVEAARRSRTRILVAGGESAAPPEDA